MQYDVCEECEPIPGCGGEEISCDRCNYGKAKKRIKSLTRERNALKKLRRTDPRDEQLRIMQEALEEISIFLYTDKYMYPANMESIARAALAKVKEMESRETLSEPEGQS